MSDLSKFPNLVIIGNGMHGLDIARELKEKGFNFEIAESGPDVFARFEYVAPLQFTSELKQVTHDYYEFEHEGFRGPSKHRNAKYNNVAKNRAKNKQARKQRRRARI